MRHKFLLLLLMLLVGAVGASAQRAYTVLDGPTLTFYYDYNYSTHTGTVYDLNTEYNNPGWYDNSSSVTSVEFDSSFAIARPTTCYNWFAGMTSLTSITGIEYLMTDNVTNMMSMFQNCSILTSLDVSRFNTEMVIDMSSMFAGCNSLESIDLSGFNTEKVQYMSNMFSYCSSLTSLDLSSFTFNSSGSNSSFMMENCSGLKSLTIPATANYINSNACIGVGTQAAPCSITYPIKFPPDKSSTGNGWYQWKSGYFKDAQKPYVVLDGTTLKFYYDDNYTTLTSTVYDLNTEFNDPGWYDNNSVTSVEFDSSFAAARPKTCYNWFTGMTRLRSITGIEYLNTENVTCMIGMFSNCSILTNLDVSGFNTAKVIDMSSMFAGCNRLKRIDLSGFNTEKVRYMSLMFLNCLTLTSLDLSNFTFNSDTSTPYMLTGCTGLKSLTIPATANYINSNACNQVGTQDAPCALIYPSGFAPEKTSTGNGWYQWKSGYFKDGNLRGDANCDGYVSLIDVMLVVSYILDDDPEGFIFANSDLDGDNIISLADLMMIVDIILDQSTDKEGL